MDATHGLDAEGAAGAVPVRPDVFLQLHGAERDREEEHDLGVAVLGRGVSGGALIAPGPASGGGGDVSDAIPVQAHVLGGQRVLLDLHDVHWLVSARYRLSIPRGSRL